MTIFVGGVHGVGKTFTVKPACESLGCVYATASELIRKERGTATWTPQKVVSGIEGNQQALIAAVRRINGGGASLVLDGHFVLRTAPNRHEAIPPNVFAAIGCRAAILIQCPIAVIVKRLLERGDCTWSADELATFSEAEKAQATAIASGLRVPLVVLDSPTQEAVEACLQRL